MLILLRNLLILLLGLIFFCKYWIKQVFAGAVNLQPAQVVFEDDFASGLNKWQINTGQLGMWQLGSDGLNPFVQANVIGMFSHTSLLPKDQYWNDLWPGYIYEIWFKPISGIDRNFVWGRIDDGNYYAIHWLNDFFELTHKVDYDVRQSVTVPTGLINGQSYYLKIIFQSGCHQIWLNNQLLFTFYDRWNFFQPGGKIMLEAGTGLSPKTIIQFFKVKVTLLNGLDLNVPISKQTNSSWANDTYDRATTWSSAAPTISRWGCALTSLVMLMRHYGLDKMPGSGENLTPAVLNQWLVAQADGYSVDGFLNWVAATRLAKEISLAYSNKNERFFLPKLEFSYQDIKNNTDLQKIISQIKKAQPVIGAISGHFFLIDGYQYQTQDLLIKDPAYDYNLLSQHQRPLQSARIFTPSQTDLSYWVLVYPHQYNLTVLDERGLEVPGFILADQIQANDGEIQPAPNHHHYFAKPLAGNYQLIFQLDEAFTQPANFIFQAFLYNQQAQVSEFNFEGLGANLAFNLAYQPAQAAELNSVTFLPVDPETENPCQITDWLTNDQDLSLWRRVLKNFFFTQKLKKYYFYQRLDKIACYAQHLTEANLTQYQNYLLALLKTGQNLMTDLAFNQLQEFLKPENLQN